MVQRSITTEDDVTAGCDWLVAAEPVFGRVMELTGTPPLRRRVAGFAGLAQVVVSQQLSNASAAAIWGRLEAAVAPFTHDAYLNLSDDVLRGCGLSGGKVKTLRGLAVALDGGALLLDQWDGLDDDEACAKLTAHSGIGPWTAEVYLLACLGRTDIWPVGDLALQKAVQDAFGLETRPKPDEMITLAEPWRPWRAVAARLLWAYYSARLLEAKDNKD